MKIEPSALIVKMMSCLTASGLDEVLGKATGMLLIFVMASDETMKKTSKKKITSIMGMISMRARLIGRWRILICSSLGFPLHSHADFNQARTDRLDVVNEQ